jgi:predicted transcriptional regulator
MPEQESGPQTFDPRLVARIVGSYVRHHKIATEQLPVLIGEVYRTLSGLGRAAPPADEALTPAVPVRRSVRPDHMVCLECGHQGQMLRRHLRVAHGLDPDAYRARWNLPPDHPLTAPNYSAQRSGLAKQIGLGRRPGTTEAEPPAIKEPSPPSGGALDPAFAASLSEPKKRRGRKPRATGE